MVSGPQMLFLALLLIAGGLGGLGFGVFALLRGGRGQRGGGIGPLSERGLHVLAGVRMLVGGLVLLVLGVLALVSYSSA
ncbi:MAG: hypothetical protein CYG60_24565 [Actinobacteria bacterium]|nr:MAG: hypothetical protein CYG60_24565 [Actinomycetota bacterium]